MDESLKKEYALREMLLMGGVSVHVPQLTNLRRIEVDITSRCNLNCHACTRFCGVSKPSDDMQVGQIHALADESKRFGVQWDGITIMGGEPGLHGCLFEISSIMEQMHPRELKLTTNGTMNERVERLTPQSVRITATTAQKATMVDGIIPDFSNVYIAPFEHSRGIITACQVHATCGLSMSVNGYAPCPVAGSIMRVLGLDHMFAKSLSSVSQLWCNHFLSLACALCGRNHNYQIPCSIDSSMWPFWKKALSCA
jgi:hypothetical protein